MNKEVLLNEVDADISPDVDFRVCRDVKYLPVNQYATYIDVGMAGICLNGSAKFSVFSNEHVLTKNELIILFPRQLASVTEISEDFSMIFFTVGCSFFHDVMSGVCRFSPQFFFYMRKNYHMPLDEREAERFQNFCKMIDYKYDTPNRLFRKESVLHILRVFYLDVYIHYKTVPAKSYKGSRKEELVLKFYSLVMANYKEKRDVAFYAGELCVSAKYLTMVMKEVSGKSAKDWIIDYVILEIKALLRNHALDIKEIVSRTKFPNQSALGRFFRKHTGMSPSQYRDSIFE